MRACALCVRAVSSGLPAACTSTHSIGIVEYLGRSVSSQLGPQREVTGSQLHGVLNKIVQQRLQHRGREPRRSEIAVRSENLTRSLKLMSDCKKFTLLRNGICY